MASGSDVSTEKEDAAFVGLYADYYAAHHIFVAEGEGAIPIARLVHSCAGLKGRKSLFYANTSPKEHLHATRIFELAIRETVVIGTTLKLITAVSASLQDLCGPTRIYAAGSVKLLTLLRQMVAEVEDVPCSVLLQRVEPGWKTAVCSHCGHEHEHCRERSFTCSHCSTRLEISEFYSVKRGAFLGVPKGRFRADPPCDAF